MLWLINIIMPIRSNGYKIPDCVTRAITTATGLSYYDVANMLHYNGKIFQCDELSVVCYEHLLDYDLDFIHYKGYGKSVEEIANDFKNHILLIRINGHLTVSMYGTIYDLFDCTKEIATDFWIVK